MGLGCSCPILRRRRAEAEVSSCRRHHALGSRAAAPDVGTDSRRIERATGRRVRRGRPAADGNQNEGEKQNESGGSEHIERTESAHVPDQTARAQRRLRESGGPKPTVSRSSHREPNNTCCRPFHFSQSLRRFPSLRHSHCPEPLPARRVHAALHSTLVLTK